MITRFHVQQYKYLFITKMTLGSKENYINAAATSERRASTGFTAGEACLTTIFGILLVSPTSILEFI
jgi:hypothetical protein